MQQSQKDFYGNFTLILGIFIGTVVAAGLSLSIGVMSARHAPAVEDEAAMEAVNERISPVARVALLGDEELAAAAAAVAAPPASTAAPLSGPQVFNEACYLCHAPPGVPGAPLVGDRSAWEARIAQGLSVLQEHALSGFQGQAGLMPPKGGRVDLSDDEVRSAVEYMVEQATQQ